MPKKSKTYNISYSTYHKEPAGTKDEYGRNKFNNVGEPTNGVYKKTNYAKLKHDMYDMVKKNNADPKNPKMYANFEDVFSVKKSTHLKSITKKYDNGTVEVTYIGKKVS